MGGRNREEEMDCGISAGATENFWIAAIACIGMTNGMMAWAELMWQAKHLSQGVLPGWGLDS